MLLLYLYRFGKHKDTVTTFVSVIDLKIDLSALFCINRHGLSK